MNYYVIGNGESRIPIDLSKLTGFKIGCNGIYLHDKVDMISAMDTFWANKIHNETTINLLTRNQKLFSSYLVLNPENVNIKYNTKTPDRGYASGTSALDYICTERANINDVVYIIGFDIFDVSTRFNHIYKGTEFHPSVNAPKISPSNFFRQTKEILWRNSNKNFVFVGECEWIAPFIKVISVEDFCKENKCEKKLQF